jgi:hypothetical protein
MIDRNTVAAASPLTNTYTRSQSPPISDGQQQIDAILPIHDHAIACYQQTQDQPSSQPQMPLRKSYSDTETINFISNHLEDVLAKGGEIALDAALDTAIERVESESSEFSQDTGNTNIGLPSSFHSSYIHNSSSLEHQYLRSNLKSALIALGSVKAERQDLEHNFLRMQHEIHDLKCNHEEKLNQLVLENEERESSFKAIMNEEISKRQNQDQAAHTELDEAKEILEEVKSQLVTAEMDLEAHRCRAEDLEQDLFEVNREKAEMDPLRVRVAQIEMELDVKIDDYKQQGLQLTSVQSQLHQKDLEVEALNRQLNTSESKCLDMESSIRDNCERTTSLEQVSRKQLGLDEIVGSSVRILM